MRIMVQNLLNDRMKLVSHFQTQEMPAYALMVAGSTVKLAESAAESGRVRKSAFHHAAAPL